MAPDRMFYESGKHEGLFYWEKARVERNYFSVMVRTKNARLVYGNVGMENFVLGEGGLYIPANEKSRNAEVFRGSYGNMSKAWEVLGEQFGTKKQGLEFTSYGLELACFRWHLLELWRTPNVSGGLSDEQICVSAMGFAKYIHDVLEWTIAPMSKSNT